MLTRLQRFSRSMCQHSSSCGVTGHSHCCWGIPRQFKFQNLLWVVGTFKKYRRDFFPCQVYWEDGNAKPAKPLCWTVLKLAISSCTQQPLYSRSFLLNPFTPEAFCWILILEYSTTTVYVKSSCQSIEVCNIIELSYQYGLMDSGQQVHILLYHLSSSCSQASDQHCLSMPEP